MAATRRPPGMARTLTRLGAGAGGTATWSRPIRCRCRVGAGSRDVGILLSRPYLLDYTCPDRSKKMSITHSRRAQYPCRPHVLAGDGYPASRGCGRSFACIQAHKAMWELRPSSPGVVVTVPNGSNPGVELISASTLSPTPGVRRSPASIHCLTPGAAFRLDVQPERNTRCRAEFGRQARSDTRCRAHFGVQTPPSTAQRSGKHASGRVFEAGTRFVRRRRRVLEPGIRSVRRR